MIRSIADLKNRTMCESNTLKQFILTSPTSNGGYRTPSRDDILIHDYQIANSLTLNSILSNFLVHIRQANDLLDNPEYGTTDSYFQIINDISEKDTLPDQTRMFIHVDSGTGSFHGKKL